MKKLTSILIPFVLGIILMSFFHLSFRCERYFTDDPDDPDTELDIDYRSINAIAKDAQEAFLSGKPSEIAQMMIEDALGFVEENLFSRTAEDLKAQGEAFKSRELSLASEIYAVFSYKYQGSEFTMTFGREDPGIWKLIRY
jgi:hypothetical protein